MKKLKHYTPGGRRLTVEFLVEVHDSRATYALKSTVRQAIEAVLDHEDFEPDTTVSVTLTDDRHIRQINRMYRKTDRATDVLSFPMYERGEAFTAKERPVLLGDIVLSLDTTGRQAEQLGHGFLREAAFLVIHGMLHLLGYDHETSPEDEEEMCRRQREIVAMLQLP